MSRHRGDERQPWPWYAQALAVFYLLAMMTIVVLVVIAAVR